MKNVLKKAIATLTATVSLSVGVCSLSANADCHDWSVRYIGGGAPSTEDIMDRWTMEATTKVYTGTCKSMSAKGTTHTAYIYTPDSNHKMVSYGTIKLTNGRAEFNGQGESIEWTLSGDLVPVTYIAGCTGNGEVRASGSVCF